MVMMPTEAATNYALVRELVEAGMDIMRINCAHDDRQVWAAMVENFRRARQELQRPGRVLVEVAGPKLCTGELADSVQVIRVRPRRDIRGFVVSPARIWLTSMEAPTPPTPATAVLPVNGAFLLKLKRSDMLQMIDARRKRATLTVVEEVGNDRWAESQLTMYVEKGTLIQLRRDSKNVAEGEVGNLPSTL